MLIPGNHERSVIPASLFLTHPNVFIAQEPVTFRFRLRGIRLVVAALPCMRRRATAQFEAALRQSGWDRVQADVRLLTVHQTFDTARCGPSDYCFRVGPDVVPRELVPRGFDYVAAGHVHRHQVLQPVGPDAPPIVYAGSPDRISFAERDEPKGFVRVEWRAGRVRHEFVEHAVRPMRVVSIDVTGLSRARVIDQTRAAVCELPSGCVVQVRLLGKATRAGLRGLRLRQAIAAQRADLLAHVRSDDLEWVTERAAAANRRGSAASAFADIPSVNGQRLRVPAAHLAFVPDICGTYALHDAYGRLLYVGKSARVRTRLRAHLRENAAGSDRWGRSAAFVEVRRAYSELEALLVESELVRRLRPAFNRHMRRWSRYCYLCEADEPFGGLAVRPEAVGRGACFGPYRSRRFAEQIREACSVLLGTACCPQDRRSLPLLGAAGVHQLCRRYFDGRCAGPCAGRIHPLAYERRLHLRDHLLRGRDDAWLARLERELSSPEAGGALHVIRMRAVRILREAFAWGSLLGEAGRLCRSALRLPGPGDRELVVRCAFDAIDLRLQPRGRAGHDPDAQQRNGRRNAHSVFARNVVDAACLAARYLRRNPNASMQAWLRNLVQRRQPNR